MSKQRALLLIAVCLAFFAVAATVGTIDWIYGVKNKPEIDIRSYQFTRTDGKGASGSLGTVGTNTAVLSPCPAGINSLSASTSPAHAYLYLSGGTGTAEAVPITSFSASGANCTVGFTTINTHTGSWVLSPNGGGTQEAILDICSGNVTAATVYVPNGTYAVYAPIYEPCQLKVRGDSMRTSIFKAQGATVGIFEVLSGFQPSAFEDIGFSSTVQQTSGGFGARLGNGTGNDTEFVRFNRIYCELMYDCLLGVNAGNWNLDDSVFYNFSHTGVTANNTTAPDNDGVKIHGSTFYNYALSTPADSCFLILATGNNTFEHNTCYGSGASQLNYGVHLTATVSSGLVIDHNYFQIQLISGVEADGTYCSGTIDHNLFAGASAITSGFGIRLQNGSGSGLCQTVISGNSLQGPGGTNTWEGIDIEGSASNIFLGGNTYTLMSKGLVLNSSGTVTLGPQNFTTSVTTQVTKTGSGTDWTAASLMNSWSNAGSPYAVARWRIEGGRVFLGGLIQAGTLTSGTTIFGIPAASANCLLIVWGAASSSSVPVPVALLATSGGAMTIQGSSLSGGSYVSLEGASYPID